MIITGHLRSFFSEIIRGIEVTAAEQGYLVLIDRALIRTSRKNLYRSHYHQADRRHAAAWSRLPFDASIEEQRNLPPMVMANEFAPELEPPTVHIDNLTAAFNAVNYSRNWGTNALAVLPGRKRCRCVTIAYRATVQALRRTGVTVDPHYMCAVTFPSPPVDKALEKPIGPA